MRIERLNFREFEPEAMGVLTVQRKSHLPGGRRKEEVPPPPPAPTFSEEQLKEAERESYKKGFLEGTEEGRRQAENEQSDLNQKLAVTVEHFIRTVAPLLADYRQMQLQLRQDMPKVALAIARKVASKALDGGAEALVNEVALACVETMIGEPKLSITVHASLADTLERKLQALTTRLQSATQCIVIRDEAIALADCRIEWKYGAMERHTGQLWQQIERAIESMVASAPRDTMQHMESLEQHIPKE